MLRRVLIVSLLPFALCHCTSERNRRQAEQYIVEAERQWAESVATGDTAVIERILADDFVGVDPKGKLYNKAQMIADTREAPKRFISNHLNQVKVRFYRKTSRSGGRSSIWGISYFAGNERRSVLADSRAASAKSRHQARWIGPCRGLQCQRRCRGRARCTRTAGRA